MPRKKWKRPDVAPKTQCVDHAFSVMRLALRYKTGLPDNWPLDVGRDLLTIEGLAYKAFPKHHVIALNTNSVSSTFGHALWDDYLLAFAYADVEKDDEAAHMVIGEPFLIDSMVICLVIAVSIERKWR